MKSFHKLETKAVSSGAEELLTEPELLMLSYKTAVTCELKGHHRKRWSLKENNRKPSMSCSLTRYLQPSLSLFLSLRPLHP